MNVNVQLSAQAQARMARGEVALSAQQMVQHVSDLVAYVHDQTYYSADKVAQLVAQMDAGELDCEARVTYDSVRGKRVTNPLLVFLIETCGGIDEQILVGCLRHASPNVPDAQGKPAFVTAFDLAARQQDKRSLPWRMIRKSPELDLEIGYDSEIDVYMGMSSRPKMVPLTGTLLDHCCQWMRALRHEYGDDDVYGDEFILDLLEAGAVLNPDYMDDPAVVDRKLLWKQEAADLRRAISDGAADAVMKLLDKGSVAHLFSLGLGPNMCEPDFWGEFWEQGRTALLCLPRWAQQQLAPDLTRMLREEVPNNVVQQWDIDCGISLQNRGRE